MKQFFPYLRYLKDVKLQLVIAIICGVLYGVSTGLGIPTLIKVVFPKFFGDETTSTGMLFLYASLPLVATAIRGTCGYLNTYYVAYCGQYLLEKMRLLVFDKIQRLPLGAFNKYTPAELITRSTADTGTLQAALMEFVQDAIKQPLTLVGTMGFLVYMCFTQADVLYLILCLLAIPVAILPIRMVGKKMKVKAHAMQNEVGNITHRLNQNLGAITEVRSFCMEESELNKYQHTCRRIFGHFLKVVKYNVILTPIIEVIASIGVGFAFYYAFKSKIDIEIFVATAGALYLSYEPIKKIGRLSNEYQRGMASLERIHEVLEEPIHIKDPEHPVDIGRLRGDIEFKNVRFAYEDNPALDNVSVKLSSGKTYALVGASGAGKTTFSNLIPRFYEVNEGAVLIDDIDIRKMRMKDLRMNISVVTQDPSLFNDTVYNNILIGNPNATREDVINAAKKAYAHDFIQELPQAYDTQLGEDGARVSGGQKQRIAIARAFLKDSPILILDEATSALDSISERTIQQALEKLFQGKTVIIIAHRFSSIKHADSILVFDKGKIHEQGKHDELFASEGIYKRLYQEQIH